MAGKLADLHSHYPMHVIAEDPQPTLAKAWRAAAHGRRIRTAIMWLANRLANYRSWDGGARVTLPSLEAGGAGLVLSVLYSPFSEIDLRRHYASPPDESYPDDLFKQITRVEEELGALDPPGQRHAFVRTADELDTAVAGGRMAFVHCVEGGFHLGATPDQVRATVARLAEHGVGYITLAHLFWRRVATNAPAIPFIPDVVYDAIFTQDDDEPLSALGVAAVEEMYARDVLIDVAHMRQDAIDATFAIVERLDEETGASPRDHPIIASHVGVRKRENGQRYNLSRDTVERIAQRGGVVGLIMAQHQLNDHGRLRRTRTFAQSFEVIAEHLDRLHDWTGSHEHSGIGSDLDGFIKPTMGGIESAADLGRLRPALIERYGEAVAEQILWGNAHRVVRGALHARSVPGATATGLAGDPPVSRIGLALSGGGHRAAFFHIGVLARLAELERLRSIGVISTVSGGSIVGTLYYLHVKALLEALPDTKIGHVHYREAVRSVERLYRRAAARNLRGRALLDYSSNLRLGSPKFSRTNRIAELLDAWFFRPIRYEPATGRFLQAPTGRLVMEDLVIRPLSEAQPGGRSACVPVLHINATTLNTGHSFRFGPSGAGEPERESAIDVDHNTRLAWTSYFQIPSERRTHTVGTAVAASAAFPGGLAPLTLDGLYAVEGKPYLVQLTDGGVSDNQGVGALRDEQCEDLIVSDAASQMPDVAKPAIRIPSILGRVGSIGRRTSREQRLLLAELGTGPVEFMHLHSGLAVRDEPAAAPGVEGTDSLPGSAPPGVDLEAQRAIARMRTDLDAFSDVEAASVMCLGYRVAGAVCEELKPPVGWWFNVLDRKLQPPEDPEKLDAAVARRLRLGPERFLKPLLLALDWVPRIVRSFLAFALGGGLALALVAAGLALRHHDVPALWVYVAVAGMAAGVLLYVKADMRGVRPVSRMVYDTLVPFVLAVTGVLSMASVLLMAEGGLHRAWGSADSGLARWAVRAVWDLVTRLLAALALTAGLVAAGLSGLLALVGGPVHLPGGAWTWAIGLVAALLGVLVLALSGHFADLRRGLAVAVGVLASAILLVATLVAASWLESRLGHRGGLPPSPVAAYMVMLAIALTVALLVGWCMAFTLRRIARMRNVEGSILPVGVALLVSVVLGLFFGLRAHDPVTPGAASASARARYHILRGQQAAGHDVVADLALARKYRPELRFDTAESRLPLDVAAFLRERDASGHPAHELCSPDCHELDPRTLAAAPASAVLDVDGTERKPAAGVTPRIYVNRVDRGAKTYLDYWVFYRFNDSPVLHDLTCLSGLSVADATCFDHEGDWEGVTVELSPPDDEPTAVIYATHDGSTRFTWAALDMAQAVDGHRPIVWVARGSHASYPQPCGVRHHRDCRQLGSSLPDGPRDGSKPWAYNSCAACVVAFPARPDGRPLDWAAYEGWWGKEICTVGLKLCTRGKGPRSPSFQKRYLAPERAPTRDALMKRR
jgi:microsomal dipeptidase-like Zn-dependent dipeptidase/predicted acylesterase/phospholipase RssA